MAVTETKGTPPTLDGYAKWEHKARTHNRGGGGVAITVRKDIEQHTQLVDDLEDSDQEIIWIQLNLKKRKVFTGVYYGKQETAPLDEVEREYSQISSQLHSLTRKGHVILTGDFNSKIQIDKPNAKQNASRNGGMLEGLITQHKLTAITTKSETGTWTREPWTDRESKSAIDYIIIKEGDEKSILENIVDEAGALKVRGSKQSDHNSLSITLDISIAPTKKTISRWKLTNEEGWKTFNEEINKVPQHSIKTYSEAEEIIKDILEKTVGKVRITTNSTNNAKESEHIKALRREMKEKRREFNQATRTNHINKHDRMKEYIQSQIELKEAIEEHHREEMKKLAEKISYEGGTKSNTFWKVRRKITPKPNYSSYETLNEQGGSN